MPSDSMVVRSAPGASLAAEGAPLGAAGLAKRDDRRLLPIVYLVAKPGLQTRLMADALQASGACDCRPVTLAEVGSAADDRDALLLLDLSEVGEAWIQSLGSDQGVRASRVALFNLAADADVEPYLYVPNVVGVFREDARLELLVRGVEAMLEGDYWFPREALNRYLERTRDAQSVEPPAPAASLTPKEERVLRALGDGASNEGIAEQLCVSVHTVKTHLYNIFPKLGVRNRVEAAMWAREHLGVEGESKAID